MNRRIAKAVDGIVTERFVYLSQLKPVAKLNPDNSIFETYTYGTKVNIPEYVIRNGNKYRIITDHLGSLRLVVDSTDGTVKQRMSFNEFGTVTEDYIETGFEPLPFGYAGGLYDRDTKLVTFGVREYDSTTGRWLEKEPLGFRGAMNFYSYAGNDPINFFDLTGLKEIPAAPENYDVLDNISKALKMFNILDFIDMVKSWGDWDYKKLNYSDINVCSEDNPMSYSEFLYDKYEDLGNFNYGATGSALPLFPQFLLKPMAGAYQILSGTSSWSWASSYFDDPVDQQQIQAGIDYYNSLGD